MSSDNAGANAAAGLAISGARKLGGFIDKRLEGANAVHAIAIQGLWNAHQQAAQHENHLDTIRHANTFAGDRGFNVRTGDQSFSIGDKPTGGEAETRTEGTQNHVENAKNAAEATRNESTPAPGEKNAVAKTKRKTTGKRGQTASALYHYDSAGNYTGYSTRKAPAKATAGSSGKRQSVTRQKNGTWK